MLSVVQMGNGKRKTGESEMTDEQRVLLIGIFMAVFLTFAIAMAFCME